MTDIVAVRQDGERFTLVGEGVEVRVQRVEPNELVVVRVEAGEDADLAPYARAATDLLPLEGALIVVWARPAMAAFNDALLASAWTLHRRKAFVELDLTRPLPEVQVPSWRTLPEAGEATFSRLLFEASEGDPFEEDERDLEREWQELKDYAGEDHDPSLWRIALEDGEPVGLVLPTCWPRVNDAGTLAYVAVLPQHRGRGLGRRLHAAGLHLLREAGARIYKGSTDVRNEAMLRVFERNGCDRKADQILLHRKA